MMEKRNFVTSSRTPMDGFKEIDEIIEEGAKEFGKSAGSRVSGFDKKAPAEDEKYDTAV